MASRAAQNPKTRASVWWFWFFLGFSFRYHSDSLHRRRAKLHGRQDGGAEPQLLRDHTKQLLRNRQPRGCLRAPARAQRGPVQPGPHAPRLHLLREFQGRFSGGVCFDPPPLSETLLMLPPPSLMSISDLTHQTKGHSPDPMEPAVGSAPPCFIWTCQNSDQCIIMPLSHPHNKVLYFSPTIAKAVSLCLLSLSLSIQPGGGISLENSNPTKPQYWMG